MTMQTQRRVCANPGCQHTLPPAVPGHKLRLTCSDRCRKAVSRVRKREEARCQEEEARRQRHARWQVFLPATRRSLEQVEALAGARLAEQLAEAIRSERAREIMTADQQVDGITRETDIPLLR